MQKDILVFSKFFGYNLGGAEKSVYEKLLAWEARGHRIHVLFVDGMSFFDARFFKMDLPVSWHVMPMHFFTKTNRFIYLQYLLNKRRIRKFFLQLSPHYTLFCYGFFAPAAINAYSGDSIYSVRDEYGLGWNKNYYKGFKRLVKKIYTSINLPFYYQWKRDLKQCMVKAHLEANSFFMARELEKISGKKVQVVYPSTTAALLKRKHLAKNLIKISCLDKQTKGIVMIGNNVIKGRDVFFSLANEFPNEKFYLFDRQHTNPSSGKNVNTDISESDSERITPIRRQKNIFFMPWQQDAIKVYCYAKVLLLPSRWYEAFSRVAAEATGLNILLLASNRGGIPEATLPQALKQNRAILIDDIDNLSLWKQSLQKLLSIYHP